MSDTRDDLDLRAITRHWLLNTAIEVPVRLVRLFPRIAGKALNVREIPGCQASDYARALIELYDSKMIRFTSEVPGDDVESHQGVSQVLKRFVNPSGDDANRGEQNPNERYQMSGMQVSFRLTRRGGEAWEKTAEPDWTRFIHVGTYGATGGQNELGEVVSADATLIIAYMGWYPEVNGEEIQLDTIKWKTYTDFDVLYWKPLPFVCHASFQVRPAESRWHGYRQPQWFHDWWVSTCSWYKKPWELPSWPSDSKQ